MEVKGLEVQFYDEGWRYGILQHHDGVTAIVVHPTQGAQKVKLEDVRVLRPEQASRIPDLLKEKNSKEMIQMATKKKAVKKGKKVSETAARSARILALRAGVSSADFKEGSHAHSAVKALEKLEKATVAEIVEFVQKGDLLTKSKMDAKTAISWICNQLVTKEKLKVMGKSEGAAAAE